MNDDALLAALGERISSLAAELIDIRRDFHAHPELSREEVRTTQTVARRLDAAGVGVRLLPGTGLLADVGARDGEHRVALRADMDALPVQEATGLPFASTATGTYMGQTVPVAHACGHDAHVAMLMGAAEVLAGMKGEISGTIVFTQMSWRTIMMQKNKKMEPGWKFLTMVGKKVVRSAANTQWVALPSDWPIARYLFGKISEMSTQITVPWPIAWAAMKAKMHAGTMEKCAV